MIIITITTAMIIMVAIAITIKTIINFKSVLSCSLIPYTY